MNRTTAALLVAIIVCLWTTTIVFGLWTKANGEQRDRFKIENDSLKRVNDTLNTQIYVIRNYFTK
jgi:hypothetical protein